jgi:hypothetical protein
LKCSKGGTAKLLFKKISSSEGIASSIFGSCQGGNGRSEFSVENSRSPESRQILQRSKESYGECFLKCKVQER